MKKAMSLLTATAMAATLLAGCGGGAASSSAAPAADSTSAEASSTAAEPAADEAAEEGKVLNIWCWNDEFQSRFNDYYPGVKEIADDKSTTTLDNGVTVKWIINPNDNNNYQNKLDEALLKQDSAAADDKIDIFLIEADYALKYVDSEYTLDVKKDVGLTDDASRISTSTPRTSLPWMASRRAPHGRRPRACLPTAAPSLKMCWAPMTRPRFRPH